ncbi:MAG: acyl-CoA synthetase [Myxococcota bacterium]
MDFNIAELHEAIADAIPERECILYRDRRLSWVEVRDRTRRLANYLRERGLGAARPRCELEPWESGQDHVALYLYNGNEYLEGMIGAFKARTVPFNVNYRYVEKELIYLLRNAAARAVIYHACFAPMLEKIRPELPDLEILIQVEDDSGQALLPGAVEYEAALASAPAEKPNVEWSPDDLYMLYTGGTTGIPKGVLWRQADIFVAALGGRTPDGSEFDTLEAIVERACGGGVRMLPSPPLMHGAAHWASFLNFHAGHTVVIQSETRRLDPDDIFTTVERERVLALLIVGDAFARPLLDQLRRKSYDLSSFSILVSGGAPLNAALKREFLEILPKLVVIDGVGSSETGGQGQHVSTKATGATTGIFQPGPGCCILSEDMRRVLPPGHEELGWFAQRGRVPLGYLGDPEKTQRTFPSLDGERYSVPGDRARLRADGIVELYGRDSVTINSGGEKIFAEEVEEALKSHPEVYDAVVVGRPSERWGQEVVGIVRPRDGSALSEAELIEHCAGSLARYKLPKQILFRDAIVRSPSGKADYRWAREQVS